MHGIFYWVNTRGRPYDETAEREVGEALDAHRDLLTCPLSEIPEDKIIHLDRVFATARRAQRTG